MAARALQGSYVRDNYPGKVPLLPQHEGSEKWGEAHGKVVKNGVKRTGRQNFLCRGCSKQFQSEYRYRGADPAVGSLILRMLERNSGVRDIESVLQVSRRCLQAWGGGKRPAQPQVLSLCADR